MFYSVLACHRLASFRKVMCKMSKTRTLAQSDIEGVFVCRGDDFKITKAGRPFARTIAARFDSHLNADQTRYSAVV